MAILAGIFKPPGEAANFPDAFELQKYTGPGLLATTGDPVPDCTGRYTYAGTHEGEPYYARLDSAYFIFWWSTNWVISITLGEVANGIPGHWMRATTEGTYDPGGAYSGNPEVAIIPVSVMRSRIFKTAPSRGQRRTYYPATLVTPAGIYALSPLQKRCRDKWAFMMRWYSYEFYQHPMRVTTECEAADVTGSPNPNVTGRYVQLFDPPFMSPWIQLDIDWYIWRSATWNMWIIAQSYPDNPEAPAPYWTRDDIAWYGTYLPSADAGFNCQVKSVTFDGLYYYVGQHQGKDHWYNKTRKAHIWWDPGISMWILATTFPAEPGDPDTAWLRDDPLIYGAFSPVGEAWGTANVDVS